MHHVGVSHVTYIRVNYRKPVFIFGSNLLQTLITLREVNSVTTE